MTKTGHYKASCTKPDLTWTVEEIPFREGELREIWDTYGATEQKVLSGLTWRLKFEAQTHDYLPEYVLENDFENAAYDSLSVSSQFTYRDPKDGVPLHWRGLHKENKKESFDMNYPNREWHDDWVTETRFSNRLASMEPDPT